MAKALVLSEETLAAPVEQPRAAQAPISTSPAKVAKPPREEHVPLQIRIPKSAAKAIKRDALEADQSTSEFLLACYHARKKA